ncbi:hypothetical protein DQ240_22790 [Blastococcus sp. TF02A-26]|nr:hypothetical protein DQ240_22790 [Blastococcus sp. TF02A-26]
MVITSGRVLAECRARRSIVEARQRLAASMTDEGPLAMGDDTAHLQTLDWVLKRLAAPYVDHPDYRWEWRP